MSNFIVIPETAKAAALYLMRKNNGIDKYKLCKILYFADQKHLVRFGRTITTDSYIRLPYGPVPENIIHSINDQEYSESVDNTIIAKEIEDRDQLSESDIECLEESYRENINLSFNQLKDKSHSTAYYSAIPGDKISLIEIAKEAGAGESMIDSIKQSIHAELFLSHGKNWGCDFGR